MQADLIDPHATHNVQADITDKEGSRRAEVVEVVVTVAVVVVVGCWPWRPRAR